MAEEHKQAETKRSRTNLNPELILYMLSGMDRVRDLVPVGRPWAEFVRRREEYSQRLAEVQPAKEVCPECGETAATWYYNHSVPSGIVDGRIKLNEISTTFFRGCDGCGETLRVVTAGEVAAFLTLLRPERQPKNG